MKENDLADKKGKVFYKIRKRVKMALKIEITLPSIARRKNMGMHHQS